MSAILQPRQDASVEQLQAEERAWLDYEQRINEKTQSILHDDLSDLLDNYGQDPDLLDALREWIADIQEATPPLPKLYRVLHRKAKLMADALVDKPDAEAISRQIYEEQE